VSEALGSPTAAQQATALASFTLSKIISLQTRVTQNGAIQVRAIPLFARSKCVIDLKMPFRKP